MKIVFATNNKHKLIEIKDILGNDFNIVSLKDIGCNVDIPETADTPGRKRKYKVALYLQ